MELEPKPTCTKREKQLFCVTCLTTITVTVLIVFIGILKPPGRETSVELAPSPPLEKKLEVDPHEVYQDFSKLQDQRRNLMFDLLDPACKSLEKQAIGDFNKCTAGFNFPFDVMKLKMKHHRYLVSVVRTKFVDDSELELKCMGVMLTKTYVLSSVVCFGDDPLKVDLTRYRIQSNNIYWAVNGSDGVQSYQIIDFINGPFNFIIICVEAYHVSTVKISGI